jgi:hypothetical protein
MHVMMTNMPPLQLFDLPQEEGIAKAEVNAHNQCAQHRSPHI